MDFNNPDCPLVSWYDWNEWLFVKKELFTSDFENVNVEFMDRSIEILRTWKNKFKIQTSTLVEASYLFVEALRLDSQFKKDMTHFNVKSIKEQALSNAIVRFVNLFAKDNTKKWSSSLALGSRQADCPKILVDVRNEISHRKFPSIEILENCAKQALRWIKIRYWDKQEELILECQKQWILDANQFIVSNQQRGELPKVEDAFDKKEKQRRKEKIDQASSEIAKIEERLIQQSNGPSFSFIVQTFLLHILVSPHYNTKKTTPDRNIQKLMPLIDLLSRNSEFMVAILKNIFILVRDFEIYSNRYNIEKQPMHVIGVVITFDVIELTFTYFESVLKQVCRKSKDKASEIRSWTEQQISITTNSEL